jgi:hypothetical protein
VLITTYDDLVRDYEELAEVPWRAVIVDEAHRLRNVSTDMFPRAVLSLSLFLHCGYRHIVVVQPW